MGRGVKLGIILAAVFAAVTGIMLKMMPGPLKDSDYLVIGTVSTLAAMLALFLVLITSSGNKGDFFFKKRKKH